MKRIKMPRTAPTTTPGYKNPNRQTVVRATGAPAADFPGQNIYELLCGDCGHGYGSKGVDNHHRRCPACQKGEPGEPFPAPLTMSLF